MESRVLMYKQDWEKATQGERATKKENLRLTFQTDELTERHRYMERKYLQLVQRVGASQEDLEAVEVLMASGQDPIHPQKNLKNGPPVVGGVAKDRIPSRLDKVRGDHHGYLYGDNEEANYRQRDQQSSHERKPSGQRQKTNIVEVLDFDQEVQAPLGNQFYADDNQHMDRGQNGANNLLQANDSGDLLKKLIDNIQNNHSLQNESVRAQFKLQLIEKEEDLHRYKNLLNAMAALFYTNHRMKDVTSFFGNWRQLAAQKRNWGQGEDDEA